MKFSEFEPANELAPNNRLRVARSAAGFDSATTAARSMGVNPVTYTSHENGTRGFNFERAKFYADQYNVSPEWLLYGHGAGVDEGAAGAASAVTSIESIRRASQDDGLERPETFLESRLRIHAGAARIIEVAGDYMYDPAEPFSDGSLRPGDVVIIDTEDRRPSPPGAFAIDDGAGVSLKLIEVIPNSSPLRLRISGRNPRYPAFEQAVSETTIVGRVKAKISLL